jgi:hypothetical protein
MKISLAAITWNYEDSFDIEKTFLFPSFKKYNSHQNFVHIHFNRNNYSNEEQEFNRRFEKEYWMILYKIQLLKQKLEENINTEYVIVADATDVFCLGKIDHLIDCFDLNNYVVASQEKNTWPKADHKKNWPKYTDYDKKDSFNETFLNAGMLFGKKEKFIEMLDSMIKNVLSTDCKHFYNCQGAYTYYYNNRLEPKIKLDYSSIFTLNTYTRPKDDCYIDQKRIVIKETGIKPCFVHDNGWHYGSPKYILEFNLKDTL